MSNVNGVEGKNKAESMVKSDTKSSISITPSIQYRASNLDWHLISYMIFTCFNAILLPQRDGMGREEGGGFRMGNTCIPVADSF